MGGQARTESIYCNISWINTHTVCSNKPKWGGGDVTDVSILTDFPKIQLCHTSYLKWRESGEIQIEQILLSGMLAITKD